MARKKVLFYLNKLLTQIKYKAKIHHIETKLGNEMKKLSAAAFNKLVKKIAYKSRPHDVSANYTLNASYGLNWYVHVHGDDTFTSIGSYNTDAIKKLKLAAQRGVVPGEEVKV